MAINNYKHNLNEPLVVKDLQITGTRVDNQNTLVFTKSIQLSADNTTGGGLLLSEDGDFVDLNDGYGSLRFSSGIRVYSGNRTGSIAITLGSNGDITGRNLYLGTGDSNLIAFRGTTGDGPGLYNNTYIGERFYASPESSELFLFKGNDIPGVSGPDRIRLAAAEIRFDTYTTPVGGDTFENIANSANLIQRAIITSAGNVGLGTTTPSSVLSVIGDTLITGITTSGRVIVSAANNTADGGGQIYLNGATGNRIDFNANGGGAPSFTTRSVGTKIVLYPGISASSGDHAFGIEGNTSWYSIPTATNTQQHRWYAGITTVADLKGSGELVLGGVTTLTGTSNQKLQVTGGAYVSGNLGVGTTNPTSTFQVKDALAFETTNTTTTNTNQVAVDTFATATFRSAKYQVQVTCPGQIATLGGITTGGRGYTAGTYNVTFTTSSGNGSAAQGTLVVSNGTVGQIGVGTTGGSGYTTGDVLTASGGSGLQVGVGSTGSLGQILALSAITSAGTGYTGYYNATTGTGTTSLTFLGGTGTGAVGLATIFDGVITSSTLLQQPTTGTGGTVFYSGSNYSTASVLSVTRSDLTNTITTITGSVGVSTFTSLTAHGIGVSDVVRVSSTSNGLTAGTDYYVVTTPTTTTFTLGTAVGVGTTFTAGTGLAIGFFRNSARDGGQVAYTNAITGVSTNHQVSDLMVLQNGTTADFIEYATIANNDILGTFASDISGANTRLLFTPTYPNNNIKVARQAITV